MEILQNNPYRILGVYSNSPTRERLANHNRMKAFLKVGKPVSFPLDLSQYLPAINRTEALVSDADAKLTLPKDQILYSQFWFIKITSLDEVAFNHLISGEIDKAEEIWQKRECTSSLQNLIVCSLICNHYDNALNYAEKLYGNEQQINQLVTAVTGDSGAIESVSFAFSFLDTLCDEIGASKLLQFITNPLWKSHIEEKTIKPLINSISEAIDKAKKSKGKGAKARLDAGTTLMKETKNAIQQLNKLLSPDDLQYQINADKLGLEILECGIDYYNDSEEPDAAIKAMVLYKYANSIVVGQMAKDRCRENIHTLKIIISKLPPMEVIKHHEAIKGFLKSFAQKGDLICYSIQLIKDCAPILVAIKEKLGKEHSYYLEISTIIVNEALGNVIAEVNAAQEKDFNVLKETLISAWRTQLYLDKFDIQTEYKNGRFKQSRQALYDIIEKCKGFEKSALSFMYKYGCGWCNHLDVSDLDLQTEEECYQSCFNLASYKYYLKKYPFGKYSKQAKTKIEVFTFQEAKTIVALENFVQQYPNSQFITQAKEMIVELRYYECKTINDFQKFINDFPNSSFVPKAQNEMTELIREEKERKAKITRQKILKWTLWVTIPLLVIFAIYLFWNVRGLAVFCTIVAVISGVLAFSALQDREGGCVIFFICAPMAWIIGLSANELHGWADKLENENKSKDLFEKITYNPTEELCKEYIQQFSNTNVANANKVRDIWLDLLLNDAKTFDYNSFKENSFDSSSSRTNNPIKKLQEFISQNHGTVYYENKAQLTIESICDSLYRIADNKSTESGWRQYQNLVPTDYFKDSESKIEVIANQTWETEPKAWQKALSENHGSFI